MKKIILFDIDGTLFDSFSFLNDFCNKISDMFGLTITEQKKVKRIYEQEKKEKFFQPDLFLKILAHTFPSIEFKRLKKIFWDIDLFAKNVYKDTPIINSLSKTAIIGIFSKGDKDFQKKKMFFIKKLDEGSIYIFPNKIDKIRQVLGNYKNYKIYLVDNKADVLIKAKSLFPNIEAILIDRNNIYEDIEGIIKIKSLNELKSIIYD